MLFIDTKHAVKVEKPVQVRIDTGLYNALKDQEITNGRLVQFGYAADA